MNALIAEARKKYHKELLSSGVMTIDSKGIPSNADSSSKLSINIAHGIADQLMAEVHEKAVGQTSGAKFEQMNMNFLMNTFPYLQNLRPGNGISPNWVTVTPSKQVVLLNTNIWNTSAC